MASAQTWQFHPSLLAEETLTDNVSLAPSDRASTDLITEVTPGFVVRATGARSSLSGSIRLPILLYLRTGGQNNKVLPQATIAGRVEAIEKFLYVEGAASIQQTYFTPFGAQPVGLSNATANRYRTDSYRVSPYIKSSQDRDITYELRDDNIWTHLGSGAPVGTSDSFTNILKGNVTRNPKPTGGALEFERTSDKFYGQPALVTQLARARALWRPEPELRLSASGGYEDNHYTFTDPHGAIYGFGADWRPSPRTSVNGEWEHRFFGSSYKLGLNTRTPLTTWSINASRNLTSYPQQLALLPAGGDVAATLNQLFLSRIADPAQRQLAIDQIIAAAGLPASLSSPLTIYSQEVYLQEAARATFGILGKRNNLLFTAYRLRTEPITGSGNPVPPALAGQNNNTQTGANVVWNHSLDAVSTFSVNANMLRTVANSPFEGTTRQRSVIAEIVSQLTPSLTVHAGTRYQILHSDIASSYHEAAIFVGLSYFCCTSSTSRTLSGGQSAAPAAEESPSY